MIEYLCVQDGDYSSQNVYGSNYGGYYQTDQ